MPENRRVVVTGLGAITPIGVTVDEFGENLMKGVSGAGPIEQFDASNLNTHFACEVKGFEVERYIDRKAARRMDKFCQFALASAVQAVEDAGLNFEEMSQEEKNQVGSIFGSGIGGIQTFYDQAVTNHEKGPGRVSPFFIPMLIPDMAAGYISMRYGLRGPNYCTVSACATANNNLIDSWMLIKNGMADMMISGGAEAAICELGLAGFNSSRALSTRNDTPETASRPFDKTRDGFVMGEGAGALVLEEYEAAKARGAKIYCEIIGGGLSADAYHMTAPEPEGEGGRLAMERAIRVAGIKPEQVDYINMHGTATPVGDVAETLAIKRLFGDYAKKISLSSSKSMTGHLLGAAGAVEAIAAILAMRQNKIPPTINFETPDPECDLDYTFNEAKDREVKISMSNAFGFGGHNTSVIFSEVSE